LQARDALRGTVLAIGGREDRVGEKSILDRFVALCGGPAARLLVVSSASRDPKPKVAEYDAAFRACGAGEVEFVHPANIQEADAAGILEALDVATGVFFVGGNQLKLVSEIGGSTFIRRLRERHAMGLHVGGTSAGAAALGVLMIARGKARSAARLSSPRMSAGFGVVTNLLIDQHFRERDRFGRLIAAVLCNPECLGLGLDEDTAVLFEEGDRFRVFGRGSVTILDGTEIAANDIGVVPEDSPAAFVGMRMHVLTEGWSYSLSDGSAIRPQAPTSEGESESTPD
jgi:cyanophycinase